MIIIWVTLFITALLGTIALMFYLTVELNELDKSTSDLALDLEKHYEN